MFIRLLRAVRPSRLLAGLAGQAPEAFGPLEPRQMLAAFDQIGLTQLRADANYSSIDGSGVTVAVLDTGLDSTHRDLVGNYRAGFDAVNGESLPVDRQGHGTHVAGLVGSTNSSIGVAPAAGLVGVKVLGDEGYGSNGDIAQGLRWVYDHREEFNIVAVNMSLGGGFYTRASQLSGDPVVREIRRLESVGVTVVSAGGNSYKGNEYQNFGGPGIASTLVVGAVWEDTSSRAIGWADGATDFTTAPDRITSFSQRLVASNTIFAPGAFLRSTTPRNTYGDMGGTSQASPVVAGAVALLQDAALTFGGRLLTPAEVVSTLISTSDIIFDGDDEDDNVANTSVSYPRLDIYAAVQAVRARFGSVPPPPPPPPEDPPSNNVPDPNGRIAGAFAVTPAIDGNEVVSLSGRIGTDGGTTVVGNRDIDMFKFEVASRGNVTISLGSNDDDPADFDSYLRLFDASGGALAADDNGAGGGYSRLTQNLLPGIYYAGVSGAPNTSYDPTLAGGVAGATGTYQISFSLSNEDPNGLISGAVDVVLGDDASPLSFLGFIGADLGQPVGSADVDLFRVTVPDNGQLLVDIDTPDAEGFVDSIIRIFDESGNAIGFADDVLDPSDEVTDANFPSLVFDAFTGEVIGHVLDSFVSINVVRGGTYYFGVSGFGNDAYDVTSLGNRDPNVEGGTYTITVKYRTSDFNGTIPAVANDASIANGNVVFGTIGLDADGSGTSDVGDKDVDFYRLRVSRLSILEADIDSTAGPNATGDPFDSLLFVYDSNGKRLGFSDDADNLDPLLQFTLQPNTDYFLAVAGYGNDNFDPLAPGSGSGGQVGQYVLTTRFLSSSSAKNLADDTTSSRRVATLTPGSELRASIGADGGFYSGETDIDLYKFRPTSNGIFSASTEVYEAFSVDTVLRIFDSRGTEISFNDNVSDTDRSSSATVALLKGKTYYVGVSGAGDAARSYNPSRPGTSGRGQTGSYILNTAFDLPPTLTAIAPLSIANSGRAFTVTYEMLAGAANEADAEGQTVSFIVTTPITGTLTQGGVPVVAGSTVLTAESEPLVWTAPGAASKPTRAFSVFASDGQQRSLKAVAVTIDVNAVPTVTAVRPINTRIDALAPPPTVNITLAQVLAAANEADKDRDPITFIIDSVLDGTLTINGQAVTPGVSILRADAPLVWTPSVTPVISNTPVGVFVLRIADALTTSDTSAVVTIKFTR